MKTLHILTLALLGPAVFAAPITYTMSGQATGFLGSTAYTSLTITAIADTTNIVTPAGVYLATVLADSQTIQINGTTTATVLDPAYVRTGFSAANILDMFPILFFNSGFAGYTLGTNLTVTGTATPIASFATYTLRTSAGDLTIATAGAMTFTAVLGGGSGGAPGVPEPSTYTAIALGLAGIALKSRFRRRR